MIMLVLCVCHDHADPGLNQIHLLFIVYHVGIYNSYKIILFFKAITLTKVALYLTLRKKTLRNVNFDLTNTINFPNIFKICKMYNAFISAFFKS